jgi:hypothetical protein
MAGFLLNTVMNLPVAKKNKAEKFWSKQVNLRFSEKLCLMELKQFYEYMGLL